MNRGRIAIRLCDAGKRYTKYEDSPMLLTSLLRLHPRSRRSQLWALRHCSLELAAGESVGVIGRNGSGKSTLLQMIAGVTAPTEGSVTVRGRVAPLVQVGVGFHPELTGRENVYVNATILGLDRATIDSRLDAIVDFAELADFIDTPVKFYSSGMYLRLGFSVAVEAEPDVLLVDEVLAVGDFAFQAKCVERMTAIRHRGTTMVVVSHNMNAIRALCDRTVLLDGGRLVVDGPTNEAISRYFELAATGDRRHPEATAAGRRARVMATELFDADGSIARTFATDDVARLALRVQFLDVVARPVVGLSVNSAEGIHIYADHLDHGLQPRRPGEVTEYHVDLPLPLAGGTYAVDCGLLDGDAGAVLAWSPPITFHVQGRPMVSGVVDLDAGVTEAAVPTVSAGGPAPPRGERREDRP